MSNTLPSLKDQQLYIFGLGREGWSTYSFLRHAYPEKKLILIDDRPPEELDINWREAAANPYTAITSADTFLDTITDYHIEGGVMFKAPGIPPSNPLLAKAAQKNIVISSNTALFFKIAKGKKTIIGVTGTKGKSTTSAMIHHVLEKAGKKAVLGGNIGHAPLDLLTENPGADIFVIELSSHQLLNLGDSPHFAVILNITPEHLDYYPDFASYAAAKAKIAKYQTKDDFIVYNPNFEQPQQIADGGKAKRLAFGSKKTGSVEPMAFIQNNSIFYQEEKIAEISELPIKGEHNLLNSLPAVVIAKQLGLESTLVREGLISFKPLEHRLEEVGTHRGAVYVNDSLSTTPEAAIAAMKSYSGKPIVLIAGGYERRQDFKQLAKTIDEHDVRLLLYFNPTGGRLAAAVKNPNTLKEEVETMQEAVEKAAEIARTGWAVLMSPASASFGRFKDYQDRGNQFTEAVRKL